MKNAVTSFWSNYFNFTGKATRSEYWWNLLFNYFIIFVLFSTSLLTSGALSMTLIVVLGIYCLAIMIPGMAIQCRRYIDSGLNIWFGIGYQIIRALLKVLYVFFVFYGVVTKLNGLSLTSPTGGPSGAILGTIGQLSGVGYGLIAVSVIIGLFNFVALVHPTYHIVGGIKVSSHAKKSEK